MFRMFLISICLLTSLAYCGNDAMFGLQWSMTTSQIKGMGIHLTYDSTVSGISGYKTDSLPKNHSMAEGYVLYFFKDSLVKILMVGKTIDEDYYGIKGKEIFDQVFDQISSKMTVNRKITYIGKKLYDELDEFYQCLDYGGCGAWVAFFTGENQRVQLELLGLKRGEGYLKIVSESFKFGDIVERIKSKISNTDAEAF